MRWKWLLSTLKRRACDRSEIGEGRTVAVLADVEALVEANVKRLKDRDEGGPWG
jgi:hypothetical protein